MHLLTDTTENKNILVLQVWDYFVQKKKQNTFFFIFKCTSHLDFVSVYTMHRSAKFQAQIITWQYNLLD